MKRVVPLLLAASLIAACSDDNGTALRPVVKYSATLSAANEVPPVTSPASALTANGTFNGVLDGKIFSYNLTTSGVSANTNSTTTVTGTGQAHIHGPAAVGVNGPVVVSFHSLFAPFGSASSLTTGTSLNATGRLDLNTDIMNATGTATVMASQAFIDALNAGTLYVNVHTTANPGGEIRGQIIKQ